MRTTTLTLAAALLMAGGLDARPPQAPTPPQAPPMEDAPAPRGCGCSPDCQCVACDCADSGPPCCDSCGCATKADPAPEPDPDRDRIWRVHALTDAAGRRVWVVSRKESPTLADSPHFESRLAAAIEAAKRNLALFGSHDEVLKRAPEGEWIYLPEKRRWRRWRSAPAPAAAQPALLPLTYHPAPMPMPMPMMPAPVHFAPAPAFGGFGGGFSGGFRGGRSGGC